MKYVKGVKNMYPQSNFPYSPYGAYGNTAGGGQTPPTEFQYGGYTPGVAAPVPGFVQQQQQPAPPQLPGQLPLEQSFIENILRLNRGKVGTFYMTFEYNDRWNAKVFKGVIEAAGRDHIIIS